MFTPIIHPKYRFVNISTAGDACIQTIWEHAPDRLVCNDVRWWPGSIADRANAPAGYSLADCGPPANYVETRTVGHVFPLAEIDALPPPPTAPLPPARVRRNPHGLLHRTGF